MMRNLRYFALLAALAVPMAACDDGEEDTTPVAPAPVEGTVRGTVTIDGQPTSGVTVQLKGAVAGTTTRSATTAASGTFEFTAVSAGAYSVEIGGFASDAAFSAVAKTAVVSTSGQTVTVDFAGNWIKTSSITGSVTVNGEGAAGVTVSITGSGAGQTNTNSQGIFSFTGLRAGSYTVAISGTPSGATFTTSTSSVTVGVGQAATVGFAGTRPVVEPPKVPATISISSITDVDGDPIALGAVDGPVNVTVNVVPNDQTPTRVTLKLAGIVAAEQTLASAVAGAEESSSVQQITLQINTAAFVDNGDGTADVTFPNGSHVLTAELKVAENQTGAATAGNSVTVTLVNDDAFVVIATPLGTSARGEDGLLYHAGDVRVRATPVLYSGRELSLVTLSLAGTDVDIDESPFEYVYAGDDELDGLTADAIAEVAGSIYEEGADGPDAADAGPFDPVAMANHIRIDNQAPAIDGFDLSLPDPTGDGDGTWINGSWDFEVGEVEDASTDNGVEGLTVAVAACTSATACTTITSGADLAETATENVYALRVTVADALGNSASAFFDASADGGAVSAAGFTAAGKFGVDKTAPTIEIDEDESDHEDGDVIDDLDDLGDIVYSFEDTGAVGASGFGTDPVVVTVSPLGGDEVEAASDGTFAVLAVEAFHTISAYVMDQAGNMSESVSITILVDETAPTFEDLADGGAELVTPNTLVPAATTTFTTSFEDNVHLYWTDTRLGFDNLFGTALLPVDGFIPFAAPTMLADQFPTALDQSRANYAASVPFIRAIQDMDGGVFRAKTAGVKAVDAAGNFAYGYSNPLVYAAAEFNGANSPFFTGVDATNVDDFTFTYNGTTGVVTAVAVGASGEFKNPFSGVHFLWIDVDGEVHFLGVDSSASVSDNGTDRSYTFSFTAPKAADLPASFAGLIVHGITNSTAALSTGVALLAEAP